MKKPLIAALALVFLSASSGSHGAQKRKPVDKASPKLFIAKVTQVDEQTKAVTMQSKDGEKLTLNFSNPKTGTFATNTFRLETSRTATQPANGLTAQTLRRSRSAKQVVGRCSRLLPADE
jgi:hypothetical protein